MTSPDNVGGFEYTDDSVIARVSFDIPGQALNDIGQLSQAMGAMRVQLEAIARAQSDWLEYLNEIPDITERANEALRAQITLLERQSYLQNEIGGGASFSGSGGPAGVPGGGYSTAAPAGYVNPWQGVNAGMGYGYGMPGGGMTPQQGAAQAERIEREDPGLAANMDSARGRAINPALLGALGAGVANVMGRVKGQDSGKGDGNDSAKTPQPTTGERESAKPPNATAGGTPGSDPASLGPPGPDASMAEKASYYLGKGQEFANEMAAQGKGGRLGKAMGNIGNILGAGKTIADKVPGSPGDVGGLLGGLWNKVGPIGRGLTAVGGGLMAFNAVQNLGEKITDFQQLGSVQGGDYMTGMKYEAQARIMALNPFITTQQARQAMQMALKEGFRGDNYDTVQDFMISNFKELGISMGQSMELMKAQALGLSEGDDQGKIKKDLSQTLNTMKELSAEGGASLPRRAEQLQELTDNLAQKGYDPESINRTAIGLQEGYGDKLALRDSISGISNQVANSDMLNVMAAQQLGLPAHLPGVAGKALNDAGYDGDEILEVVAKMVAGFVTGFPDKIDRVGQFMSLMQGYGVELTFVEAEALYDSVTGEESPTKKANRKIARQGKTETRGGSFQGRGGGGSTSSSPADKDWTANHPSYSPSENAAGTSDSFEGAGRGAGTFAPSGYAAPPIPARGSQDATLVSTTSQVSGEVRITVDQQGRVTAPQYIQLTGQQKAALAGHGSSQLNNAPPGDPTYMHAYDAFPASGGRMA